MTKDELKEKEALIRELRDILASEGRIHEIIKEEMLEIKRKYADERRTEIVAAENEIVLASSGFCPWVLLIAAFFAGGKAGTAHSLRQSERTVYAVQHGHAQFLRHGRSQF